VRAFGVLVVLLLAVGCGGPRPEKGGARCSHVQAVRKLRGLSICEDVWTCARPPGGAFDRVGLHRLAACEGADGPVVLYLPGMHMNGELPLTDARYDLRLYLAQAGVRTWGLDYRTHVVPPDAAPADLAALGRWTADLFADDAVWAAGFVRGADPGPIYLAGFSFGAGLAYRVAAKRNQGLAGLIILDGFAGDGRAPSGEGPAIDVGGSRLPFADREILLERVAKDPESPSPLPGFPTAGAALSDVLFNAQSFGGQGGLANTRDNISDVVVLAKLLASYDRWWPRAALGGSDPGKPPAPLPVLAFASTQMGPSWVERVRAAATAFGGEQARVRELPRHGHLDVLVGRTAARQVFEPVRAWLEGQVAP
jgi:pimeloyl-ACP methyl ester carboxylesterase